MDRELLRSWLRLISKRKGLREAERARRWPLLHALRLRALKLRTSPATALQSRLSAEPLEKLLDPPGLNAFLPR